MASPRSQTAASHRSLKDPKPPSTWWSSPPAETNEVFFWGSLRHAIGLGTSRFQSLPETKSYMEIFNYSDGDSSRDTLHDLSDDEFENFVTRKGVFSNEDRDTGKIPMGVTVTTGIRLVVQVVQNEKTFLPNTISLTEYFYTKMFTEMKLPLQAVETTSAVGPLFWWMLEDMNQDGDLCLIPLKRLHNTLMSRLDLFEARLEGLQSHSFVSMERFNIQREVLHNIINQRESRLSLKMAAQQSRLADANKKDSTSMKKLALLGAIFLPGTLVSSVLSTSFFDFSGDLNEPVSPQIWRHVAIAGPLTLFFVVWWAAFDHQTDRYMKEDRDTELEKMRGMEIEIMQQIRDRAKMKVVTGLESIRECGTV